MYLNIKKSLLQAKNSQIILLLPNISIAETRWLVYTVSKLLLMFVFSRNSRT